MYVVRSRTQANAIERCSAASTQLYAGMRSLAQARAALRRHAQKLPVSFLRAKHTYAGLRTGAYKCARQRTSA